MANVTSFKAGGRADALIRPESVAQLRRSLLLLSESGIPYMVMGNGSNILFADGGYHGVVLKIDKAFSDVDIDGEDLTAGAGALLSETSKAAMEAGLSGMEFASGIPGSVGGAVFMNAGAYGSEMKNIVKSVDVVSLDGGAEYAIKRDEMEFSYRRCVLHRTGDIVTGATFRLSRGDPREIKEKMRENNELRNAKQPVSMMSAGSFFKRPEGYFAGKLIQDSGLKGLSVGGAMISELHAGFIVNTGNARASDIIDLMEIVQAVVYDKFGVRLEPEVRIIGE